MIAELAQDLITNLKTVTALNNRVGLAVGGRTIDPLMEKVIKPACWVIYMGDETINETDEGQCVLYTRMNFVVKVLVDYASELDLITNQYPILENIISAVNATTGPIGSKKWKYEGQSVDEIASNRLVFDQRYSIVTTIG